MKNISKEPKAVLSKPKILKFRAVDKDIFEAVVSGKKKIETRAATKKYKDIKPGDAVVLKCGKEELKKIVLKTEHFASISAILKKYSPEKINPKTKTEKEAREMWSSFPGYKDKIRKHGLLAMHFG